MAKNSNVVLEGVSLADLARELLEDTTPKSNKYTNDYIQDLCGKLRSEGIVEASDLLRTSVEVIETNLARKQTFNLGELADTLTLREKIAEISGYHKSRPCEVGRTRSPELRRGVRDRSRSRRRNVKSRDQNNRAPHRVSLDANSQPEPHCRESVGNQGRSFRQQRKSLPHSNGPDHTRVHKCKPPLWEAVENNQVDQVIKLIDEGCNIEEKWKGWTPLMKAAEEGYLEILDNLLGSRADLTATNRKGRDALSFAAAPSGTRSPPLAALRLLLERGADPNHIDGAGMTAKMRATKEGYKDAVACFEEFAARAR